MNREDIIRMAREAGAMFDHMTWVERDLAPIFERFAALVADAEREDIAQMVEDVPELMPCAKNDQGGCVVCGFTPSIAAAAIRSRGNT